MSGGRGIAEQPENLFLGSVLPRSGSQRSLRMERLSSRMVLPDCIIFVEREKGGGRKLWQSADKWPLSRCRLVDRHFFLRRAS